MQYNSNIFCLQIIEQNITNDTHWTKQRATADSELECARAGVLSAISVDDVLIICIEIAMVSEITTRLDDRCIEPVGLTKKSSALT